MNEQAVFHVAKATPWKKYAAIAAIILAVLAVGFYYLFAQVVNPITPQSVNVVMTTPAVATPLPPAPAASAPTAAPVITECNCKCECFADKKVSKPPKKVKKPIRKPVVKAAPAMPPAPRYVPPVYNKPYAPNRGTGVMQKTRPMDDLPVLSCGKTTGGVPCK